MLIEIKNRHDNKVILCGEYENIKDCLQKNRGANLWGADLWGADLWGANLWGANLWGADLRGAYLWGADLRGANLGSANLWSANLRSANLGSADLRGANLGSADLRGANLGSADLRGAKNYSHSHDFWIEIIRRQNTETFTEKEWAMIGIIFTHRLCWGSIKKRYGKKIMPLFKKLSKVGFGEWSDKYSEILREWEKVYKAKLKEKT